MQLTKLLLGLLLIGVGCSKSGSNGNDANGQAKWPEQPALPQITGTATFNLLADDDYLNVMENTMPRMPLFPQAKQKELKLTGFVADLSGKPVEGAYIGLRSAGTVYIAASAETDANGYYEMSIPLGGADVYAAGYTIDYGAGRAALSLYPTDGRVALSNPSGGVVKNFVVLSYGLADANKRAAEPWSPLGYFGGSLRFDYSIYDAMWNPKGLPANTDVELKLEPVAGTTLYGEMKTFTVTKRIGQGNGNFVINNLPVGTYNITAKLNDGRQVMMKYTGPYVSQYPHHGLQPREATGTAKVLFTPTGTDPKTPNANQGYWRPVSITIGLP
jgi:hypothetical protein